MSINYNNLVISGIDYISVKNLVITQRVNEHASAVLQLEVSPEEGKQYLDDLNENDVITIGAPLTIFAGVVDKVKLIHEETYFVLDMELSSTSSLLDNKKINRSYQQIGEKYSAIMKKAINGYGKITFVGNDIKSEAMLVQYNETIWEFILRLVAECNEPVYVNPTSEEPGIIIGNYQSYVVKTGDIIASAAVTDETSGSVNGYVPLGSIVESGGNVAATTSRIIGGELITTYTGKGKAEMICKKQCPTYAGRVMSGIVKAVNKDKVQVHITDLDENYDELSNVWFPYSTLYSSENNMAGVYCMPVEDDVVRVFFPSENLKNAFVSSSYTMRGKPESMQEKQFITPDGMTVLFGKDGLFIQCGNKKTGIYLMKDGWISIESEQDINIHAKQNIAMRANEGGISIQSDKEVCMGTGRSLISMNQKGIIMVSDRIMTQ